MPYEPFELELYGGAWERRYRKMRPEVEAMPWDSLDVAGYPAPALLAARRSWTGAAFQEHRTAAACAETLRCLVECRAPLDLVAVASRFPLDEMVHVELCARMAMHLGGGTEILHDPSEMIVHANMRLPPLLRALELVVYNFCVGEALSIPMIHGTWHAAMHPLSRAILGRILKDEAAHGAFGFTVLDWADSLLDDADREHLRGTAGRAIAGIHHLWDDIRARPPTPSHAINALGWMQSEAYLELAQRSMVTHVVEPLRRRGIAPATT